MHTDPGHTDAEHLDPELLTLLALGEQVEIGDDRSHLETCAECGGELSELRRLVTLGRSVESDTTLTAPSPQVWVRIREELALDPVLEPRRSPLAAIKAALAGPTPDTADQLTARATLAPVEASWSAASGAAVLATDELGRRILQVGLDADLPPSGFRQAWLVHRDDPTLKQTLGIFDGSYGVWTVDKSIDLGQYAILDVSQQGAGDTVHSGQTIVRGELQLVG